MNLDYTPLMRKSNSDTIERTGKPESGLWVNIIKFLHSGQLHLVTEEAHTKFQEREHDCETCTRQYNVHVYTQCMICHNRCGI